MVQRKAIEFAESNRSKFSVSSIESNRATEVGPHADTVALSEPQIRPLRVALLGCGTVGGGVYQRLAALPEILVLLPPRIKQLVRMLVPKVNTDGNEVGGVPIVLLDAPLGTYMGWNITADGAKPFHKGQMCSYAGGMVPFAKTRAERTAANDPRPSLEERYGDHAGYVAAVKKAAANAVAQQFLLQEDADALVAAAEKSRVLR